MPVTKLGFWSSKRRPVEAQREQDERDVRVGQQVQERLERVHGASPWWARPPSRAATAGPGRSTVRPSACASSSSSVPALKSMAPAASASSTVYDGASATVLTAQSTGRPRASAMAVMDAIGVVHDLVAERRPRCPRPGRRRAWRRRCWCPAPWPRRAPASVMNVPALAARPPAGATHTMTGRALEERLDDVAGRLERAARGVELDDDGGRAVGGGRRDAVAQVARHDLVDDARGRAARRRCPARPRTAATSRRQRPAACRPQRARATPARSSADAGTRSARIRDRRLIAPAPAARWSRHSRLQVSSRSPSASTSGDGRERSPRACGSRGWPPAGPPPRPGRPRPGAPRPPGRCRR